MIWITPFDKTDVKTISNLEKVSIPKYDLDCIKTVIKKSDICQIWIWGLQKITNLPDGVVYKDASEFFDIAYVLKHVAYWTTDKKLDTGCKMKLAQFADLLRYHILEKYAGWYLDTDIVLCHALPTNKAYMFATSPNKLSGAYKSKTGENGHITNCAMYVKGKNSVFMRNVIKSVFCELEIHKKDIGSYKNFCCFMNVLRSEIAKLDLNKYIVNSSVFCPMPWFSKKLWKMRVLTKSICYGSNIYTEKDILGAKYGIIGVHLYSVYRTDPYVKNSSIDHIFKTNTGYIIKVYLSSSKFSRSKYVSGSKFDIFVVSSYGASFTSALYEYHTRPTRAVKIINNFVSFSNIFQL